MNLEARETLPERPNLFPLSGRAIVETKIDYGLDPENMVREESAAFVEEQEYLNEFLAKERMLFEREVGGDAREEHMRASAIAYRTMRHQASIVRKQLPTVSKDQIRAYKEDLKDAIRSGKILPIVALQLRFFDGTIFDTQSESGKEVTEEKLNQELEETGTFRLAVRSKTVYDSVEGLFLALGQELSDIEPALSQFLKEIAPERNKGLFYAGAVNTYYPLRRACEAAELSARFNY